MPKRPLLTPPGFFDKHLEPVNFGVAVSEQSFSFRPHERSAHPRQQRLCRGCVRSVEHGQVLLELLSRDLIDWNADERL